MKHHEKFEENLISIFIVKRELLIYRMHCNKVRENIDATKETLKDNSKSFTGNEPTDFQQAAKRAAQYAKDIKETDSVKIKKRKYNLKNNKRNKEKKDYPISAYNQVN